MTEVFLGFSELFADMGECALVLAIGAVPLFALVLLADTAFSRWLSPSVRCCLWLILAVRLLLPGSIPSPWSLPDWGPSDRTPEATTMVFEAPLDEGTRNRITEVYSDAVILVEGSPEHQVLVNREQRDEWIRLSLGGAWALVAAAVAARLALASLTLRRRLRRAEPIPSGRHLEVLHRVTEEIGLQRPPRLVVLPGLEAPVLVGWLRPVVCLPTAALEELDAEGLRLVLLHELTHIRRGDAVWSWLLAVLRVVQWFNPVAWLVIYRFETCRELACDESVAARTTPDQQRAYVDLLLRYATGRPLSGAVGLTFAQPRGALPRRVQSFAEGRSRGWLAKFGGGDAPVACRGDWVYPRLISSALEGDG